MDRKAKIISALGISVAVAAGLFVSPVSLYLGQIPFSEIKVGHVTGTFVSPVFLYAGTLLLGMAVYYIMGHNRVPHGSAAQKSRVRKGGDTV